MRKNKKGLFSKLNVKIEAQDVPSSIMSCNTKEYKSYNDIKKTFLEKKIDSVFCIGLGDPCCNLGCRKQASLILSIASDLNIKNLPFFDPCTCENCKAKLKEMGFDILADDKNGCYSASEGTCFYMPHCPLSLYHNLINANLTKNKLKDMMIIGNSFEERTDAAKYEVPRVYSLVEEAYNKGFVHEKKLDFGGDLLFHSTSIMTIDADKLPSEDDDFWKQRDQLKQQL